MEIDLTGCNVHNAHILYQLSRLDLYTVRGHFVTM